MPDPKDNAKMTGDTHLPDAETDDLAFEEGMTDSIGADGTPRGRGKAAADQGGPGRGIRKAGLLKDSDDNGAGADEQRDADQRSGPT